jgi:oligopeptide transport system substrate-binding protein
LPVELLLPNREEYKMVAEVLQAMWRKHLGIIVPISVQEWGVYIDSLNAGRYHLAIDSWSLSHPYEFYDLHRTGNTLSRYRWSNEDYDQLLGAARSAVTVPARNEAYGQLERVLAREMPIIPLYFPVSTFLLHPTVRGFHSNRQSQHPWKYFDLEL